MMIMIIDFFIFFNKLIDINLFRIAEDYFIMNSIICMTIETKETADKFNIEILYICSYTKQVLKTNILVDFDRTISQFILACLTINNIL